MRFRILALFLVLVIVFIGCGKKDSEGGHKIEVKEVIQVTTYTYVRAVENGSEIWIAAPKMEVKVGQTLYYDTAMVMPSFQSTELKRTFSPLYMVQIIGPNPIVKGVPFGGTKPNNTPETGGVPQKPELKKEEVKVDKAVGGLTIAELLSSQKLYENKSVKIKGKVTKVNNGIMGKNWIHIQDGTSNGTDFDLTITTLESITVGEVSTFEGSIALEKDFGAGYKYKIIMEDAKVSK